MADKDWRGLSKAVERPDFLQDSRFTTAALREENKDARTRLTQEALLQFNSRELLTRLESEDVPCAPVLTRREMIRHPQIDANQTLLETTHPSAGTLRQAKQPAQFSVTSIESPASAPALGQHTVEVLTQAGFTEQQIKELTESGAAIPATDSTSNH